MTALTDSAFARGPTPAAVERFERDGFLTVGQVLSPEVCGELRRQFEHEAAHRRAGPRSTLSADRFERVATDGRLVLSVLLDHAASRLDELEVMGAILTWATALLDVGPVTLLSDEVFVKPAGCGDPVDWHQDWIVYPERIPHFLTCWIALGDMSDENGALEVGVGTHLLGRRAPNGVAAGGPPAPVPPAFEELVRISEPSAVGHRTEALVLPGGEAVFHHALTWHRSGPNRTRLGRTAIALRFRPARW